MSVRFLLPFLVLAIPGALGQIGLYGRVGAPLKAGDIAADIQFSKVLSAPGDAQWSSSKLSGQLIILIFLQCQPDSSSSPLLT
jgi:hypothetical protein